MGFLCLLLYVALSYLSPESLFPQLAPYRLVLWLAIACTLLSLPQLADHEWLWSAPQMLLLLALVAAMIISHLAHFWFGGALFALEEFLPTSIVFFFICVHARTWERLRILTIVICAVAFLLLGHALWDLYAGNINSPYLMSFYVGQGYSRSLLIRLRAVGYLSDPNDFSQFLLVVLPFISLAWRKGSRVRNFALVIVPSAAVIYVVYLTHSRGAMIALLVLAVVFLSRRVSLPIAIGAGGVAYIAMMALGWTGGRDLSIEGGSDRIYLWEQGLHLFRLSPLWGVGYGKFSGYAQGLTAHNSYILCLAEIGLIGYTFWLAAIVVTFMQLHSITSAGDEGSESSSLGETMGDPSEPAIRRWATALEYSLYSFLVTAWFLSRTYTMTLYVLLGMAAVLVHLADDSPEASRKRTEHWLRITVAAEVATIVALYVIARLQGLSIRT